jgi:hypothetical protein
MNFLKKSKWFLIVVVFLFIAGCLFITFDNRNFLKYGALHISKVPKSLKIINYNIRGLTDQEYQYYISVEPAEFGQLLIGRTYIKQPGKNGLIATPPDEFPVNECYTSGNLKSGLVSIFVNANKSQAYVIYLID